ncbi:MAG TPA: GNAT family N-acetyltransferase [Woeseiaceae bacterium]|nr:GNAT family N-acetyltransferase [Woeseiaceae bacterium]
MQISPITEDDLEAILSLNSAAVPHVNRIGVDELSWFCDNASFAKAVKIDARLAGFMIGLRPGTAYQSLNYRWFCEHYDDFAYVDRVVVADWARRRGIAEALYRDFSASQADVKIMTCEVNIRPANEASMNFHRRMGFRQVGTQEVDNGEKEVALLEMRIER